MSLNKRTSNQVNNTKNITNDITNNITNNTNKYSHIPKDDIYNLLVLQINNLLEELLRIFPTDILLKVAKRNMSYLYKNKVGFLEHCKKNVNSSMKEMIINKNEDLFENDSKLKNTNFKRSGYIFSKIRKNWKLLSPNNKEVMWKYMITMNKLIELLE